MFENTVNGLAHDDDRRLVPSLALAGTAIALTFWLNFAPVTLWPVVLLGVFVAGFLCCKPVFYAIVFCLPLNPYVQFGLPIHDVAALVRIMLFAGIFAHRLLTHKPILGTLQGRVSKALLAFCLIALLSVTLFNPIRSPLAAASLMRLISYVCFYCSALWFLDSEEDVRRVIRLLLLSTVAVDLFGFVQLAVQDYTPVYHFLYPAADVEHAIPEWSNRITSILGQYNFLAGYLNLLEPFALSLWLFEKKRWAGLIAVLTGVTILCTQSRGGIFALACTLLLTLRLKSSSFGKFLKRSFALVVVAVPLLWLLASEFPRTDIGAPESRPLIWFAAFMLWKSHPIFGVGWGNFRSLYGAILTFAAPDILDAHNLYLQVLTETGIVGCLASFLLVRRAFQMTWSRAKEHDVIAVGCFAAILSILTHGFVDALVHVAPQWMAVLFLVFGLAAVTDRERAYRSPNLTSSTNFCL